MANKYLEILNQRTKEFTPVIVQIKDNKTASLLKALASGKDGEFTAVSKYFYQYVITLSGNEEIAVALEQISINEMAHQEELMKTALAFGGNPTYTNGQGSFWNGRYVNYEQDIKKYLQSNIKNEELAILNYTRAKNKTNNQSLKQLYSEIIHDEELHIKVFNLMLESI